DLVIPLTSRLTLRLYVVGRTPDGSAILAAAMRLEKAEIAGQAETAAAGRESWRDYKKWTETMARDEVASLVLDRWGNLVAGRWPWPEATCYNIPRLLANVSTRPDLGRGNPAGRFRASPRPVGRAIFEGRDSLILHSSGPYLNIKLYVDITASLPAGLEAEYGYQTFRTVLLNKLRLTLNDVRPDVPVGAFVDDPVMAAGIVQACALSGRGLPDADLITACLSAEDARPRKIAAAALAVSGIPTGVDLERAKRDKDEVVRFNIAKAEFRHLGQHEGLEKFLKSGSPELRERAAALLAGGRTSDARLFEGLLAGTVPPELGSESEVYALARKALAWPRTPHLFAGPRPFAFVSGVTAQRLFHCNVNLPDDFDPAESWPVMIQLSGGNGYSESAFLRARTLVPDHYILVEPDADYGLWWEADQMRMFDDLVEFIVRSFPADPDRIYLQGFSNGGIAAYLYGARHADRFAAVAALEGYFMSAADPRKVETELALNFRTTPLLIMHGARDMTISPALDRQLVEFLRQNGIPHRYLELPGVGHQVSFMTVPEDVLRFFGQEKRKAPPNEVTLIVDEMRYNRHSWVRVEEKVRPDERAKLNAAVKKDRIVVKAANVKVLSLLLSDGQYAEGRPIEIVINGRVVRSGPLALDPAVLAEALRTETDPARLYGVKLTFSLAEEQERDP
ncbi:MAG: hypothetical protein OEW05_14535, partial [Candidatus Aminicenantes bacterium]|nr:hypothetical protein [Candidatus Aminicenantes bacterium]